LLRLVVDGVERVRVNVSSTQLALAQGEAALLAEVGRANFIDFDDVRIGPNDAISDDFRTASVGQWDDVQGTWQTQPNTQVGGKNIVGTRAKVSAGRGISLIGSRERSEGKVEAKFALQSKRPLKGVASPLPRATPRNYLLARRWNYDLQIVEYAKGAGKVLASVPGTRTDSKLNDPRPFRGVARRRDSARHGDTTATATVSAIPAGRVGTWIDGTARPLP
jgi:hypothetical protein